MTATEPAGAQAPDFDTIDFYTDPSLVEDPYPYFEHWRNKCPVAHWPHHDVIAVTGYEESAEIYRQTETFSSANAVTGPFPGLPVEPEGDDITDLIIEHRHVFPMFEYLVTLDPPEHTQQRGLTMRLFTPKRMAENEEFMQGLAHRQIDEFIGNGTFEVLADLGKPIALLVIADLLGLPEADHKRLARLFAGLPEVGDEEGAATFGDPLAFLAETFAGYLEDRRANPRDDVLTQIAQATYPDGSLPEIADVVRTASFLFAAGQETTAKLVSGSLKYVAEEPHWWEWLREDRSRIPGFLEEVLRMESPVKSTSRLVRHTTEIGGVEMPAGTTLAVCPGAANRDPRHFPNPDEFDPTRANAREHLAFGRGVHACPGAPLARVEAKIVMNALLDRIESLKLNEEAHGTGPDFRHDYEPTYILRGLTRLVIDFVPKDPAS
ncbi:MAG: cytochrome P450 [Acidimicrobiales bacterium]|nr:cytochrome P450 [Acidimicrobiales bacterium]